MMIRMMVVNQVQVHPLVEMTFPHMGIGKVVMRRMGDVGDDGDGNEEVSGEHNEFDAHDTSHVSGLTHTASFGV